MNIADVYDWFAQESIEASKQASEWKQREMFMRLALMWAAVAQQCRQEGSTSTLSATSSDLRVQIPLRRD
jgi:hypothetical protein